MSGKVVDVYEEVFTERKVRTVRVTEDVHAGVSAWHGGREVTSLGGWTCVEAALDEARRHARTFGVGPGSTLAIRVSETRTRRWEYPDRESGREPRPSRVVLRRHVHDVVAGDLEARPARLGFTLLRWLGLPPGEPPEGYLACYRDVEVRDMSERLLFDGYGHSAIRHGAAEIVDIEDGAIVPKGGRGERYHRVRMAGTLDVTIPPGGDPAALLRGAFDIDVGYDWSVLPDEIRGRPGFRGDDGEGLAMSVAA